ncbi:cobalt-factor II C(20)-methyltransferase [Halopelagius longus]|uniref:Cobalt-factor II C(20)-methyltransferase n=1 Tax=Halopelagius longus TaxID=1236180 RepID=A0A1H0ZF04_9EURY|nr:cobalt-factor II C(20)-methyltransferase [Halopelagius longus]RDI70255.1 cobalt-factor II C(20)-methyltransferase [Halopelagius longus]SDQ25944.1 precorrin-2/cobalt-factor-2 C20-methyltransferase [Halopelagius longus]
MTLYGVGLGPGDADLVTVRGRRVLEEADVVYSPGRLSRSVATEHVPEDRIGDVDFPMTRDEDELRRAWKEAAAEIAPRAREGTAAFVTLGDPNVYSTFGHLRRTLSAFHPEVELDVVPGVSAVTAFTTALGVEISSGSSVALHEAARGAAPTGPDRMVLFKVTDVPATHERLTDAGYDVVYGRRLYMEQGETVVTDDPEALSERDYYTLAYAEKRDVDSEPATATFEERTRERRSDGEPATTDGGPRGGAESERGRTASGRTPTRVEREELAEGEACGDEPAEVQSR